MSEKILNKDDIWQLNTTNLIYHIRLDLFYDFMYKLVDSVFDTFPGFDVMDNVDIKIKHFESNLNDVVELFKKINVVFQFHKKLKTIIYTYFMINLYNQDFEGTNEREYLKVLRHDFHEDWVNLFKYYSKKNETLYDKFKMIYHLLEGSIVFNYR